jgi:pimeloyl-ACP methyl ester carboxylesterase
MCGRWRTAAILVATMVVVASCATETATPGSEPPATSLTSPSTAASASSSPSTADGPVGQAVDIGERELYLVCQGTGPQTVILEAGLTGDHRTWDQVMPELADSTRVCAYDRANVPPSDPAEAPRTAADSVDDLEALLAEADVEGPLVLVGFSFGGLISQLYAATHPDDIAAVVLVESNHPDEWDQFSAELTPEQIEEDREFSLDNSEGIDPYASYAEAQTADALPDVPLIVITAGQSEGWPPGWDPETFDGLRAAQQADLVTRVTNGCQLIAESSAHHVPSQQPAIIVTAVESVLAVVAGGDIEGLCG